MFELKNRTMHYAWGDIDSIPRLLGQPSTGQPCAEFWLGAHPSASSTLASHPDQMSLDRWIKYNPDAALGNVVTDTYGSRLPFLVKILAVAEPLSLQVHPSSKVARAGFRRESKEGPDLISPQRNYKDPFHKPEMIYALTAFRGLAGFRAIPELIDVMRASGDLWLRSLAGELEVVKHPAGNAQVIKSIVREILAMPADVVAAHIQRILHNVGRRREAQTWAHAENLDEISLTFDNFELIAHKYPQDPGALVSLLLSPFSLAPGQAHFVPAGTMHCYLSGMGLEIMATSDNVLRAGLTVKHVDVQELLLATEFDCTAVPADVLPVEIIPGVQHFASGADEFELLVLDWTQFQRCDLQDLVKNSQAMARLDGGPRIVLCLEGSFDVSVEREFTHTHRLAAGKSLFVPASTGGMTIAGEGRLAIGRVPGA